MEWYYILLMVLGAIAATLVAIKVYIKLTTGMCRCKTRLDGKTAIVTGANTGIGYEAAKEFARRGARVILACRSSERGLDAVRSIVRDTGHSDVVYKRLDLASLKSVRDFARDILTNEQQVHILVNNAGAGALGNYKTADGIQVGLQVNHFGSFLLTNLLLERMVQSAPARVVMVSAWGHKMAEVDFDDMNLDNSWTDTKVYCNSKLYNICTANEIARRIPNFAVTANSLHPGIVMTDIFRNLPALFRVPIHGIIKLFLKSAYEGAQSTIYLAVSPDVAQVSGSYYVDCKPAEMSAKARDPTFTNRVWELSEQMVKLQPQESYFANK